ncbi:hypothetical protein C4D60_Mb09t11630 [Musa balbisiana]|uniref:GPI-anchored protein LLG1-like domain-containing protein n=1 Tax=Musa balbisiana TaxID=52838 RepID=A0A4S8IFT8_MUSBA|nr:hypothetical protein C4D60_Mb09t11630 [Musa balbisiana]
MTCWCLVDPEGGACCRQSRFSDWPNNGIAAVLIFRNFVDCPLNFEFMNYTIITSQCKGPRYPADLCCGAFKEFACPYAAELNDLTNKCASTMFTYINLNGPYPPGLFASECHDDKIGLLCPASAPQSQEDASSGYMNRQTLMSVIFLACGVVLKCLLS